VTIKFEDESEKSYVSIYQPS